MSLQHSKNNLLISAVLASTLFGLTPITHAAPLVLNTLEPGPYSSNVNGNVTVSQTGAIQSPSGVTPYTFNSGFNALTLSEGNKYYLSGTLLPTDTPAVEVLSKAINNTITIGPVSSVVGGANSNINTIDIHGDNTNLYNAGNLTQSSLTPGKSTVYFHADNAYLLNDITGIIINNPGGHAGTVRVDSSNGFILDNRGLIQGSNPSKDVIEMKTITTFDTIQNSGFIVQTGSSLSGISSVAVVDLQPSGNQIGNFTNDAPGVILQQGNKTSSNTIYINGDMNSFLNEGFIGNLASASSNHTSILTGSAVYVDVNSFLLSFQNKGLILNKEALHGAPTVVVFYPYTANPDILNPLNNTGFIVNEVIGKKAIDFSQLAVGSFNNTGVVVGDVYLAREGASTDPNNVCGGFIWPILTTNNGAITGRVIGNRYAGDDCSDNNRYRIVGGTLVSIENAGSFDGFGNFYNLQRGEIIDYVNLPFDLVGRTIQNVVVLNGTSVGVFNHARVNDTNTENAFIVSGGSFYAIEPTEAQNIFLVSDEFTSNGLINAQIVTVGLGSIPIMPIPSTFTQNQLISGVETALVLSNSQFNQNAVIQGPTVGTKLNTTFLNLGTHNIAGPEADFNYALTPGAFKSAYFNLGNLNLGTQGVMRIRGNNNNSTTGGTLFGNGQGGFLNVFIDGPQCAAPQYGKLVVDSFTHSNSLNTSVQAVVLGPRSFIQPLFSGFLPRGSTFDIITVYTGGYANPLSPLTITNNATLVPYPSALVYFTEETLVLPIEGSIFGNDQFTSVVRLTANRNTFLSESSTKVTKGIAQTLDSFADQTCIQNTDIYRLISEFDQLPTQSQVENSMESLVPGFNYALIAGSHVGMDSAFEAITDRVYDLAFHRKRGNNLALNQQQLLADAGQFSGSNYGDINLDFGFWARAVGAYLSQSSRQGIAGYIAKGEGLAIGGDWGPTDCSVLGVAASYTKVNVDDKSWAPKDDDIKSWQGTLYGAYEFDCGLYLDAMVAYAHNDYKTNRVIHVNNLFTAAQGSFDGRQWGAQGDLGIELPNTSCIDVVPFVRLKYITVDFDSYTETGGGTYSLNVSSQNASEFLGGAGLRVGSEYEQCGVTWIPEVMALIGYDFHLDGEQTLAGFVSSTGPAFGTNGIVPGRTVLDVGIALNGISGASIITAKYNLEVRDQFVGSAAYLQYYYAWS